MKKSFNRGIKKYYEMHPEDAKMDGILMNSLKSLLEVNSYQQVRNYIRGTSKAKIPQLHAIQNLFSSYGITDIFDK